MKFYGEINPLKIPLSVLYKTKESWKNYNTLFSQESVALYQLSHTDPDKTDQHLANFLPLLSLPTLHNSKNNWSLVIRKFNLPKLWNTSWEILWLSNCAPKIY